MRHNPVFRKVWVVYHNRPPARKGVIEKNSAAANDAGRGGQPWLAVAGDGARAAVAASMRRRTQPNLTGETPQMSFAYSMTARSDEKRPERAMLTRDMAFHFFASRYVASTLSCASE